MQTAAKAAAATEPAEIDDFETDEEHFDRIELHIDLLARAWRAMKDGRKDEALANLEGVLCDLDNAWMTRT